MAASSHSLSRVRSGGRLRRCSCMLTLAALVLLLCVGLKADEIDKKQDFVEFRTREFDPATLRAISRGLAYLAAHQEADGSWKDVVGRKINNNYVGTHDKHVGATALACMSFMAHGDFPGRGRYGENVRKGLEFIMNSMDMNGYVTYGESRMYSHAFATLFLAEVYGMSGGEDVGQKLRQATDAIVRAQNAQGAWRYKPDSQDSDLSITVCQVMALRAARNSGVAVPSDTVKRAIEYVKKSASPSGAFYYQIYDDRGFRTVSRTSLALTAAGVAALQGAGDYYGREVERGVRYLYRNYVGTHHSRAQVMRQVSDSFEFLYGQYYASQAMYQAGGKNWTDYSERLRKELLLVQQSDGRWQDPVGPNYATAMATLILQIPFRYLPIFQR